MTEVTLSPIWVLLGLAVNGAFTGMGVAVGTWFVNKRIKHVEQLSEHMKRGVDKILKKAFVGVEE